MEDLKKEALAEFLNSTVEEIEEREEDYYYSYDSGRGYLVLTEKEANLYVREKLKEILFCIDPLFLSQCIPEVENATNIIELLQGTFCDSCNDFLYFLIKENYDILVNDMITEGRENIIAPYDGNEYEIYYKNNWFYIYQID